VRAFIYCLPVLCIDGTFLTGKYKGTILTAIGIDCNKQIVPIVFAFVENENTESWYWFLERLKNHVVVGRPNVCIISDRHAGLLVAIRTDVVGRWCVRHMAANFYERFKNKDLMNLFKRLCAQNQQRKFDALWGIIDDMSAELLKSQASSSSRRRSTDSVVGHSKPFSQWIDGAPKEKWSLLYDTDGRR